MLVREIVNSCSNDHVAQAALGSIGGTFAARIEALAESEGLKGGSYAAGHVASFKNAASARDWDALRDAIRCHDQPVLAGLRHILQAAIEASCVRNLQRAGVAARTGSASDRSQSCFAAVL